MARNIFKSKMCKDYNLHSEFLANFRKIFAWNICKKRLTLPRDGRYTLLNILYWTTELYDILHKIEEKTILKTLFNLNLHSSLTPRLEAAESTYTISKIILRILWHLKPNLDIVSKKLNPKSSENSAVSETCSDVNGFPSPIISIEQK